MLRHAFKNVIFNEIGNDNLSNRPENAQVLKLCKYFSQHCKSSNT